MSQRVVYVCDRCERELREGEARYELVVVPHDNAQREPDRMDLCGFCAGQIDWALHEADPSGRLVCEIPRPEEETVVA